MSTRISIGPNSAPRSNRAAAFAASLLLAIGPAAAQPPAPVSVSIPGTRVTLPMPDGFVLAGRFPGLAREEEAASVMVSELPESYEVIAGGFTDQGLAGQGMTVRRREAVEIAGRAATLIHVRQEAAGSSFLKWMGIFGDREATVLVVASYPESGSRELGETLRATVLGAGWDRAAEPDPYAALGYRVDPTDELAFAHETPHGIVLLPPGVEIGVPGEHTMLVVGRSFREVEIDDLAEFSRHRLRQVEQLSDLSGLEGAPARYGGFPAYELVGSGREGGREVVVYQAVLVDGSDYVLLVGTAAPAHRLDALATFRKVAASVRRAQARYELALACDRDRLLFGTSVACALRVDGYAPSGLPGGVAPASSSFVPGARLGARSAGFVYAFEFTPEALGDVHLGPLSLSFEGRSLTSNRLSLRVLEPPPTGTPVALSAFPPRVGVGEALDVVVVERGIQLGGLKTVSSVRIGGKPVIAASRPSTPVALVGNEILTVEPGASVTTQATGADSERITFYRVVAHQPGQLTLGRELLEGLGADVEVTPATVEVVAE